MSKIPPLRHKPLVFLDTETTGLKPEVAEIIEIAVLDLDGNVLLDTKVKPVRLDKTMAYDAEGTKRALEINGYSKDPTAWKDAPTFEQLVPRILEVFEHKVIVGQNPTFDRSFVVEALSRNGVVKSYRKLSRHMVDTTTLALEHLVPCGLNRVNLDAICEFLGIELDRSERHGALADARACRSAYLMMLRAGWLRRLWWTLRARFKGLGQG
jgi:DNA polymerase-3 subunit alpha (Gram-positive type)